MTLLTIAITSTSTLLLEHYGKTLISSLIKHYIYKGTQYVLSKCYNVIKNKLFNKNKYKEKDNTT